MKKQLLQNCHIKNDCWQWTGAVDTHGYGQVKVAGRNILVHRLAYELWVGLIQNEIHHTCENPLCFNPKHLRDQTKREHVHTHRWPDGRCKRGHDVTKPENLIVRKNGTMKCRPCERLRQKYLRVDRIPDR